MNKSEREWQVARMGQTSLQLKLPTELEDQMQGTRDIPLHPAIELAIARMSTDPAKAETYVNIVMKYKAHFTKEERCAIHLKLREVMLEKLHVEVMKTTLK